MAPQYCRHAVHPFGCSKFIGAHNSSTFQPPFCHVKLAQAEQNHRSDSSKQPITWCSQVVGNLTTYYNRHSGDGPQLLTWCSRDARPSNRIPSAAATRKSASGTWPGLTSWLTAATAWPTVLMLAVWNCRACSTCAPCCSCHSALSPATKGAHAS